MIKFYKKSNCSACNNPIFDKIEKHFKPTYFEKILITDDNQAIEICKKHDVKFPFMLINNTALKFMDILLLAKSLN